MNDFFSPENIGRKLKLDLHTHCYEALGFAQATPEVVKKIIDRVKIQGLDGLAVTEHWDREYGYRVQEIVRQHFDNEILILPGREFSRGLREEIVEFYLPQDRVFRIWVHPRTVIERSIKEVGEVQGIEVDSDLHGWEIDRERARAHAQEHGLLMLDDSDAHTVYKIGSRHNVVSLEELCSRAVKL